jgi:hypothetical protein
MLTTGYEAEKQIPFGNDKQEGQIQHSVWGMATSGRRQILFGMTTKKANAKKQIPFGNDNQEEQQQIPFGNDKHYVADESGCGV